VTSGDICVFGDARVGYWQGVGNDHSFVVGGDLSVDILFQGEHDIHVVGDRNVRVEAHMDMPVDEQLQLLGHEDPAFHVGMETARHNGEYLTSAFIAEYLQRS